MSLTIELTAEEETQLKRQAAHYGSDAETLVTQWIRRELIQSTPAETNTTPDTSGTLYDALKEYIGSGDSSHFDAQSLPEYSDPYEKELAQIFAQKYGKASRSK